MPNQDFAATPTSLLKVVRNGLRMVANGFATWQRNRARRLALATLLEMDPSRLDDLGLNAQDVAEALYSRKPRAERDEAVPAAIAEDCAAVG